MNMRRLTIAKPTKSSCKITDSTPDLESCLSDGNLAKEEVETFSSPVRIHIHSRRKRLTDADGVSAKAAIDGLVHGGLLEDDSAKFVQEVSYSQEKSSEEEETIITIEEI